MMYGSNDASGGRAAQRGPANSPFTPLGDDNLDAFAIHEEPKSCGEATHHTFCGTSARALGTSLGVVGVVMLVAAAALFSVERDQSPNYCQWVDYRLPGNVKPAHYAIRWSPQFKEPYLFTGQQQVQLDVVEDSDCIVINMNEALSVTAVAYQSLSGPQYPPLSASAAWHHLDVASGDILSFNADQEQLTIHLPSTAPAGSTLALQLGFSGPLDTNMNGLYLSTYTNDQGATVPLVATQFEATHARLAMPCFDEPALKATFNVTLTNVPAAYTALSNMPVASSEDHGSTRTYTFFESVPMSTYLVAVVAGDLMSVETTIPRVGKVLHDNDGISDRWASQDINVRVFAPNLVANQGRLQFALDSAASVLGYFPELFGVAYPLPKADLVAIPDFAAGAMENWGLVTYRETALLADPAKSSAAALNRVAIVVAHELVHQWFGNLVTEEWWSALFLAEGFASLFEYAGAFHSRPEYPFWDDFVYENPQEALRLDSLAEEHALVRSDVDSSLKVEEQFDSISYNKGASVLFMLWQYLEAASPGSFEAGLRLYLEKNAFGNTWPVNVWEACAETSGIADLPDRMHAYTWTPGYSVVRVQLAPGAAGAQQVTLAQRRFFHSGASKAAASQADQGLLKWIPMTLLASSEADTGLAGANAQLIQSGGFTSATWSSSFEWTPSEALWFKPNANATGYFRISYPDVLLQALTEGISRQLNDAAAPVDASASQTGFLGAIDRSNLVDDAWSVLFAGEEAGALQGTAAPVLNLTQQAKFDSSLPVWRTTLSWLYGMDSWLSSDEVPVPGAEDPPCLQRFRAFALATVRPIATAVGWGDNVDCGASGLEADPVVLRLRQRLADRFGTESSAELEELRIAVLNAASYFGDQPTIDCANTLFNNMTENGRSAVPSSLLRPVVDSAVRWGGDAAATAVRQLYVAETDAADKVTELRALGVARDPGVLEDSLNYAVSAAVRSQDTTGLVLRVAANPRGRRLAWQWYTSPDNFDLMIDRYGDGGFAITNLVSGTANGFTTDAMADEVAAFYADHPVAAAGLEVQQAIEDIHGHSEFLAAQQDAVCSWLEDQGW